MPLFEKRTNKNCEIPKITETLVFLRLSELDVNKEVGADGVSPHVLVKCASALSKPLRYIFNLSLSSGICPVKWKQANVTSIFKKGSRLEPGNYRPVYLTSILCKTLEKIITDAIMKHLVTINLINAKQHGFVKGKACVTNLLEAVDLMTKCLSDKVPIDYYLLTI